jgi:hypothetical protein
MKSNTFKKNSQSKLFHDIRNCLAIIKAEAEVAMIPSTPKNELLEALKRIEKEADKINYLLR